MENLTFYLLLLVAVIAGWLLGRLSAGGRRGRDRGTKDIFDNYFVGLNYLLNDEPDEAIDTFIKALEINSDTIETHLALGALLRRRGKVDKAIKVHQALLARPGLEPEFADSTKLQLAIDYITGGLLDRAERLLREVLNDGRPAKWEALQHLITIYQTEKEWQKAADCAGQLLKNAQFRRSGEIRAAAAHFCCELAEQQLAAGEPARALECTRRALDFDKRSVRACLILADVEQRQGHYKAAIRQLLNVQSNNPEFVSQVLPGLARCYEQLHNMAEYERQLHAALAGDADVSVVLAFAELVKKRDGEAAAISFLNEFLSRNPSFPGLVELLRLQIPRAGDELADNLGLLQQMVDKLLHKKAFFRCNHCGYESRKLNWLCPSCQKWDKVKPINDVALL